MESENKTTYPILKALFLISAFLLVAPGVWGQEMEIIWERMIQPGQDSLLLDARAVSILPSDNGQELIIAGFVQHEHGNYVSRIFKTDLEGNIVWNFWKQENCNEWNKKLIRIAQNRYVFLTAWVDENHRIFPEFICIDDDGEEIWRRIIEDEHSITPSRIFPIWNDKFIFIGISGPGNNLIRHIFIFNDNGNITESAEFPFPVSSPIQISEDRFLFNSYDQGRPGNHRKRIALFQSNTNLDSIDNIAFDNGRDATTNQIYQKNNGNFIVVGADHYNLNTVLLISEISKEFEVQWFNIYGDINHGNWSYSSQLIIDDRLLVTGYTNLDYQIRGLIIFVDSDGREISRIIDEGIGLSKFRDCAYMPNRKLYIIGETYETSDFVLQQMYFWLCKISYPNQIENEDAFLASDYELISIFPNPFNSELSISLRIPYPIVLRITIFNSKGQFISDQTMNCIKSGLYHIDPLEDRVMNSVGTYFLKIQSDNKNLMKKVIHLK